MNVYVIPSDKTGCGHYRLMWPAHALKAQGINVQVIYFEKGVGIPGSVRTDSTGKKILTKTFVPPDADVIVFQRLVQEFSSQMVSLIRENGIAVVIDIDDDFSRIHPRHIAFNEMRPGPGKTTSWTYMKDSCINATLVTSSTQALQKIYARHGRGVVLDNYVPARYLDIPRYVDNEKKTVGWAGTLYTHVDDHLVLGNSIQRLEKDDIPITVIGDGVGTQRAFRMSQPPAISGGVNFGDWPEMLMGNIDVGIAPLAPSEFNRSKSRLKPLEYMSLGIPWVGSPSDEYRRLRKESGVGSLAHTPRDWYDYVKRLVKNDDIWIDESEAGRAYMQDQTYEKNAWRWAEAWQRAIDIQRGKIRA